MLTKRIIPCLDVMEGRVVKGMNFVNLKDAGDPQSADLIAGEVSDILPRESHLPPARLEEAGDDVEESCFTRSISADDPKYLPLVNLEIHFIQGRQPAEVF